MDWDDLWCTRAGELAYWDGLSDRHLNDINELRSTLSLQLNGMQEESMWVDKDNANFQLLAESPLIDAALPIPGVNQWTTTPDIGCYEFGTPPWNCGPSFVPTPESTSYPQPPYTSSSTTIVPLVSLALWLLLLF
eukprot:TRINITY_DN9725_c0_g1_i1.p2 TRINITY_DN9725_c0_g1~~TRINITY_DN9725_c0_g1_i1.p2  ORF type:complete len:135 (+),score=33.94 TRINITY_DN9725_c0_g1_i1:379-783(+)